MNTDNRLGGDAFGAFAEIHPMTAWSAGVSLRAVRSPSPALKAGEWLRANAPADRTATGVATVLEGGVGPVWSGVSDLSPALRAAFAAMLWGLADEPDLRDAVLVRANAGESVPEALLSAPETPLKDAMHRHVSGVWRALVADAKDAGVAPRNAALMWLSETDRTAWLILLSHGRDGAFCECLGAVAHARMEEAMRTPLEAGEASLVFAAESLLQVAGTD